MKLRGPQTTGRYREEKYLSPLPEIEPKLLSHPAFGLATVLTGIYRIIFKKNMQFAYV
jgi:hypothetical protein